MRTLRRLIYGEILWAVAFVLLAFLSLFTFFDFVDELPSLGRASPIDPKQVYSIQHALLYLGLMVPSRIYELLPIAVLIGSVFVLARLAQSSEYTILRTSGLGPWRALRTLMGLGVMFVALTFAMGDYLAPLADKQAQLLKAHFQGRISVGQTGAWLKEGRGDRQFSVNVKAIDQQGVLQGIRIFEFDDAGHVASLSKAGTGEVTQNGHWVLKDVERRIFSVSNGQVKVDKLPQWQWDTEISADMVSVALLKPDRMRTLDLFTYISHLKANNQNAQRYEIEFWRKVFYPLSCIVMVVLALPFAYLHFRSGGVSGFVFMGVMIGISFFLLNNVFGYIGNLRAWEPWLAAASPALIYTAISLAAFGWLVLKR